MAKFRISGVPITEGTKLVGIITNRDLKFETDFSKKIKESMTSEGLVTAKEGITLEEAKRFLQKQEKKKLPIVDDDGNLKDLSRSKILRNRSNIHWQQRMIREDFSVEQLLVSQQTLLDRVEALVNSHVDVVVMDSAHGHSANVLSTVRMVKDAYPDLQVIAGNVATGAGQKH